MAGAGLHVALWIARVHVSIQMHVTADWDCGRCGGVIGPFCFSPQDKIQKLYERKMKEGMDMNYIIQRKKEFRNPRYISHEPAGSVESLALDCGLIPWKWQKETQLRSQLSPKRPSPSLLPSRGFTIQIQAEHKPVSGVEAKRPGLEWGAWLGSHSLCF